jgi:hypothetical protein
LVEARAEAESTTREPEISAIHSQVLDDLRDDLEQQLGANLAMPAVLAASADGKRFPKTLMPLDTGGQALSDAQMADLICAVYGSKGETPAVIGWVRLDVNAPEIISLDLGSSVVVKLFPLVDEDDVRWRRAISHGLDERTRGGGGADDGALLFRHGAREEIRASRALDHIGHDALLKLEQLVASGHVVSSEDVSEDLLFDLGAAWGHGEVPRSPGRVTLSERLLELRAYAERLDSTTTAIRFRHQASIYIFALYRTDEIESCMLLKTAVKAPGELAAVEDVSAEELAELLGRGGAE